MIAMTHNSATYFGNCWESGSHSDGSPFKTNKTATTTERWRKRAISRKIYNVDRWIFIGNMRPSTLLACGLYFFPFHSFLFFSLALKCPFHFPYVFLPTLLLKRNVCLFPWNEHYFMKRTFAFETEITCTQTNSSFQTKRGLVKNSFSFQYQTPNNRWRMFQRLSYSKSRLTLRNTSKY